MSNIDQILKKYTVIDYANTPIHRDYYTFSAPSLTHIASGGKNLRGIRSGSVIELVGKKSCGKSTLSLDLIAQAQKLDRLCAYVDYERTLDPVYAERIGVDTAKLLRVKPDTAEQGLNIIEDLLKNEVSLIVVDSIAMMLPKEELDKDYDDSPKMALSAGLLSRFIKRITPLADNYNALVVLINQIRANFSTGFSPAARKETKHYGGYAIEHGLQYTIEVSRVENKDTFARVQAFVEKNKMHGAERLKTEFIIEYGKGIRSDLDILDMAIAYGIVSQRGAWIEFCGDKYHGRDNAVLGLPLEEIQQQLESILDVH